MRQADDDGAGQRGDVAGRRVVKRVCDRIVDRFAPRIPGKGEGGRGMNAAGQSFRVEPVPAARSTGGEDGTSNDRFENGGVRHDHEIESALVRARDHAEAGGRQVKRRLRRAAFVPDHEDDRREQSLLARRADAGHDDLPRVTRDRVVVEQAPTR